MPQQPVYVSGATIAVTGGKPIFQDTPRTESRGSLCAEAQKFLANAGNGCCNRRPPEPLSS